MINKLNGLHKKQKRKKEEEKAAREAVVAKALQKQTEDASAPEQYAESA
jgi:predicted HAD superfamily Cof-like phosphohydrolase